MTSTPAQDQWRPKRYPSQSYQTSSLHATNVSEPEETPQIPMTIRALQHSRDTSSCTRTLVICLDGTGDKFDDDNSNVVNFVACLKKDSASQITYYQSGIGTYNGHGLSRGFSAAVDMAVGSGLGVHIRDAYRFIMQNYQEGDKICLLGFSRGSYTVRCLAGMLHKVGLLPAGNDAQVSFAYGFYKDDTPTGWRMSAEFKQTFCTNVNVYFVGVWDCVASVGFFPRILPFSKSPTNTISYFRHAMALDEHRAKFKCCQWQRSDKDSEARILAATAGAEKHLPSSTFARIMSSRTKAEQDLFQKKDLVHRHEEENLLEWQFEKEDHTVVGRVPSDVLEVWFAGAHCDVGGGAVPNQTRHMLSRIPLRWMIRQCFACNTGIMFDTISLSDVGIDIPTLWPAYIPNKVPVVGPSPNAMEHYELGRLPPIRQRSTAFKASQEEKLQKVNTQKEKLQIKDTDIFFQTNTFNDDEKRLLELLPEQVEDHFDALQPMNDMLVQAKSWWILEFWPVKVKTQTRAGDWEKRLAMNLGRFRPVQELEPKLHWTVKLRIERAGYKLRNNVARNALWNVTA